MQITIQKVESQVINLSEDQVKDIATQAILKKLGLSENYRVLEDKIYDDFGRCENMFVRNITDVDRAAFSTIALLCN
ncbi:hypothetical protein [Rheinheimera hassiensis]|uniref:hypothetical protein n=1 Tax=Rheinheimera hassiensis TaxID=1193627 RepID=UPI001F068DDF|nr:hypothetical protein [Rheinheimera hassiensis]